MNWGAKEYYDANIDLLKEYAEHNSQDNIEKEKVLVLPGTLWDANKKKMVTYPKHGLLPEKRHVSASLDKTNPGYQHPNIEKWGVNQNYDVNVAFPGKFNEKAETSQLWYSPRPKKGYVYVPGFDYINPAYYVEAFDRVRSVITPYGEYQRDVRREQRRAWARRQFNAFQTFINPLRGGPACAIDPNSQACGVFRDTMAFSIGGAKVFLSAYLGAATGGTGAAIAGASSALLADPALGLGDDDLGRILVALAEAYAIANVTDAPIKKVMQEALENQMYSIAKREIGKSTGLDQTALGRLALDLTAGTAFRMYKDASFTEAIKGSADKGWRLAVARENPYGAILVAGVTEVEKNGFSIDSLNPLDWFENMSFSKDEFTRIRRSIRGKDLAKLIGLTYMVSAGKVSEGDALLMIGQEASVRNIDRFYQDEPVKEDPELKDYRKMQRDVARWKKGIATMQKLSRGVPPSRDDIASISENVATPIYDRVKAMGLPTQVEVKFWDIAVNDVGLPNVSQYVPDIGFTTPEWMRSSKTDGKVEILNETKVNDYLDNKFTEGTEFTKEDLIWLIINLFPRNVPLVPIKKDPGPPTFNHIDDSGNLKIRDPLRFPYDHPMLKVGHIEKKYTKEQKAYMMAREAEMRAVAERIKTLEERLA